MHRSQISGSRKGKSVVQRSQSGKPVVLVIEAEPLLRMAAVDMMEDAGFDVTQAADATKAIEILETRSDIRHRGSRSEGRKETCWQCGIADTAKLL